MNEDKFDLMRDVVAAADYDPGCYIHGPEPIPENCFRICGECGHAYTSEEELLCAHNSLGPTVLAKSADGVWCCPLCTHDW